MVLFKQASLLNVVVLFSVKRVMGFGLTATVEVAKPLQLFWSLTKILVLKAATDVGVKLKELTVELSCHVKE